MTKQEFEKLAGLEVRPEEYQAIEAVYMNTPEENKVIWVAQWKRYGGIDLLLRTREQIDGRYRRLWEAVKTDPSWASFRGFLTEKQGGDPARVIKNVAGAVRL
jgi:hypothetical protein